MSTCLFDTPYASSGDQISSPCVIEYACAPLEETLTDGNLNANSTDTYSYCDAGEEGFGGKPLNWCISCLQASSEQQYLSNCMFPSPPSILQWPVC